jgi:hypothetical protein
MSEEQTKTNPVIRISIASAVGDKTQMSFETYVDQLTPVVAVNGLVDRLMEVKDRQLLKQNIKDKELLHKNESRQVEATKMDYARTKDRIHNSKLNRDGRVPGKTSLKDSQDLENLKVNIETRATWLEKLTLEIEEDKAKLEGIK